MAVTFTPNIGLAKPDDTELALNWARGTQLQDDNNVIIKDQMDIPIQTYTPVFGATTTVPNVGTGSLVGEYQELPGGLIVGSFLVTFLDTGIVVGAGEYGISLPVPIDPVFHVISTTFSGNQGFTAIIGEGYIYDFSNSPATSGSVVLDGVTVAGVSYARLLTESFAAPVKTNRIFAASMPFAVANNDRFCGNFFYKKQ